MIDTVYVEEEIRSHPRVERFLSQRSFERIIPIERYSEVFNRKAQDFRLQKKHPALILAQKHSGFIHPIPESYGIGGRENYYFSHVLNCPFDCSYCFLQGMYRSAHYVWFINYEDFQKAIIEKIAEAKSSPYFFSGYDGDSLALEGFTHFAEEFLPFFEKYPEAFLELRTKSLFLRPLLARNPIQNCIVAFTLSPASIAKEIECKAPPLAKRLENLVLLQEKGWKIGLRFDPLLYDPDFYSLYQNFFEEVFKVVRQECVHSATLGVFRLPKTFHDNMKRIQAAPKLLALLSEEEPGKASYPKEIREKMVSFCHEKLLNFLPKEKIFIQ